VTSLRHPRSLAVLISGNGSNLQAIIDACAAGGLPAQVVQVISNHAGAFGLVRAERAGIATHYFPFGPYRNAGRPREAYDGDLAELVAGSEPDLVVLAGWMHVLSPTFLTRFTKRVVNLHPALPGCFPGTEAIARAFEAYNRGEIERTGVMVHWVDAGVDTGPVIATAEVPIYPADTLAALEKRVHETEHRLLVAALGTVCELT
jgi:formyltetrahydrofolate-dependent phosphoribosylglycinamide formyltransferase